MGQEPRAALTTSSATSLHGSLPGSSARPALPGREVTEDAIEDAYVSFILYCNPAVPADTDTAALREAFHSPPKSGGKSFRTYALFQLIKQLESKELKTWIELALKLGVEPPDQDKGQSSQRIQQYAVRLKRWMRSMHMDAFFEYLMGRPSPYWTGVPSDPNPAESLRDGVAAEDDMALRALLPQIRPRRGRRKADDDDAVKSPSQQPAGDDEQGGARFETPWSAHPDNRGSVFIFPASDPTRPGAGPGQPHSLPWSSSDVAQTPLSAYPQSAITPSAGSMSFWLDEPSSAITPSRARPLNKRHGAKVVSSAWRNGPAGSGKARGRPPMNRGANDGPSSAFPTSDPPSFRNPPLNDGGDMGHGISRPAPPADAPSTTPAPLSSRAAPFLTVTSTPPATARDRSPPSQDPQSQRPAKRGRLSLLVPARVGGEVRLATPPPAVVVSGQAATGPRETGYQSRVCPEATPPGDAAGRKVRAATSGGSPPVLGSTRLGPVRAPEPASPRQQIRPGNAVGRTSVELESALVYEVLTADWYNAEGSRIAACDVEEAHALVDTVIESLRRSADSEDGFLIGLAALAGARLLMGTRRAIITLLDELPDRNRYSWTRELSVGGVHGRNTMEETVVHSRWRRDKKEDEALTMAGATMPPEGEEAPDFAQWRRRYIEMYEMMQTKDKQLADLRSRVATSLCEPAPERPAPEGG